ncbi:3-demethylubiquinone-9 3-methyltransferase [Xylogone sp. PMI_703]|nr:3-demethylubiquinone-9 3-methyltransferase [Xylogone sp. PMI_703]
MPAKITPCLWFDGRAEEAANFYTSIFKNGKITHIQKRIGEEDPEIANSILVVAFELDGQTFTALNGGPLFKFNEAISFQIDCANQAEVDCYWEKLREGGDPSKQQCGWVEDKFGVSWQVVPRQLIEVYLPDPDPAKAQRTYKAMLEMKKLDIDVLKRAYDGESK